MSKRHIIPLNMLNNGNKGRVIEHKNYGRGLQRHMEDLGLNEGVEIKILSAGNPGPFLLELNGCQVAVGQGMAEKILVENVM